MALPVSTSIKRRKRMLIEIESKMNKKRLINLISQMDVEHKLVTYPDMGVLCIFKLILSFSYLHCRTMARLTAMRISKYLRPKKGVQRAN
uniref:Uncharacterized protein n=1 Tax=Glossina palpalis gambiensis TaxID=67801 RepID=A0A1B0BHK6_9MUSC